MKGTGRHRGGHWEKLGVNERGWEELEGEGGQPRGNWGLLG